mmetsp:Transcript_139236/g.197160  ORF Transcript_139236/g.197160 Transcript_139236/m.197160 type:complete len:129 (+) Transcript_139236:30-416(+)
MGDAKGKPKMKEGMTVGRALYEASRDGRDDEVDSLLKSGAPVDYQYWDGWQSIHVAAMKGHSEIVKRLIISSADVLKKDEYGETPHMIALRRGNEETAELINRAQREVLKKLAAEKEARKSRASKASV